MIGYVGNIETITEENQNFRQVLFRPCEYPAPLWAGRLHLPDSMLNSW